MSLNQHLTARDIQSPLKDLDLKSIPLWSSSLVDETFLKVRDERWLTTNQSLNFKRRIPWLYVDNGCFLKAALIRKKLEEWDYPPIKKIFCFGNMDFNTPWAPNGRMTYKDHVAVIVRTESDCLVFDPSVFRPTPLPLNEWIRILFENSDPSNAKFSICSALTVGHNSNPYEEDSENEMGMRDGEMKSMAFFAEEFLEKEWNRIIELGLDPVRILGESPPWR